MLQKNIATGPTAWRQTYLDNVRKTDALVLVITVAAAQLIRFGFDGDAPVDGLPLPYWSLGVLLGLSWWGWLELRGTRDVRLIGNAGDESREVVTATLYLFGALAIASWALDVAIARGYVIVALPLGVALLITGRWLMRRKLFQQRLNGVATSRTLVVGRFPGAMEMVTSLQDHPMSGLDPVAMYAPHSAAPLPGALADAYRPPNLLPDGEAPSVNDVVAECKEHRLEVLVLCANAPFDSEQVRRLGWSLADERIRLILDTGLTDVAGPRIHPQHIAGLPLIHVSTPRLTWGRMLMKRGVDIMCAGAALLVLSPLLLALALIVKAHDGGPAFFAHERVGLDGRSFRMLKFRTMRTDAAAMQQELMDQSEGGALLFKLKNDPRVTRPGRWMRKYSADELPQLINVLRGDMSLVGPRPQVEAEVAEYEDFVHRRLRVKPGITGLWQVSGRNDLSSEQAVRLDVSYVENWSLVQDFVILLRTVKVVVSPEGAY